VLAVSLACWPAGRGHHGVALVVPCWAAPHARVLPRGSRPTGGPVCCALAAALLPLTLRSECPPSPQTVQAWAIACRRTLPWLKAHRPPSRLAWPVSELRVALMFPHRVTYSEPRSVLPPERPPWRLPCSPCRPAVDRCRSHLAVLAPVPLRQQHCSDLTYLPVLEIDAVEPPRPPILECRSGDSITRHFPPFCGRLRSSTRELV
jgi:hypothetical protein